MVLFGNDVPRCDRALVMNAFTSQRCRPDFRLPAAVAFDDSFVVELEKRGHDISTFRFSIERKEER